MNNDDDMKSEMIEELKGLRQRVTELEEIDAERERKELQNIESRRKRNRYVALGLAMFPIVLGIVIFMINSQYFMEFNNPETRFCGLPLLVTAIVLAIAAYPALRRSFWFIESERQSLGYLLAVLVITFMIFPAILILFLGPAAMVLLSSSLGS